MEQINLLIVEDNLEMCEILKSFFEFAPEIHLCGTVHNGEDALRQIALTHPDVLLLDIIMPKMDGISVLEQLNTIPMQKKPQVIVTSAIGQENVTNRALSLGASYYMIKPYNFTDLLDRIRLITSVEDTSNHPASDYSKQRRSQIAKRILELGMTSNLLGYQYCIDAVWILLQQAKRCLIVKDLYATIARDHDTTAECVESAIRKAIQRVYLVNNETFRAMAGDGLMKQPSNGRFLTMVSEHLKMDLDG